MELGQNERGIEMKYDICGDTFQYYNFYMLIQASDYEQAVMILEDKVKDEYGKCNVYPTNCTINLDT